MSALSSDEPVRAIISLFILGVAIILIGRDLFGKGSDDNEK
jgi:hypothetical protein